MKLVEVKGLDSIAKINHDKEIIMVDAQRWNSLPAWQKKQILLHELGHNILDTRNEMEADEFAFQNFVGTEKQSLKKTIAVLKQNLDTNKSTTSKKNRYSPQTGCIVRFKSKQQSKI